MSTSTKGGNHASQSVSSQIEERIINVLVASSRPMIEAEVVEAAAGRRQQAVKAIRALVAASKIERTGSGRRGDPFRYSALYKPRVDQASSRIPSNEPLNNEGFQNVVELMQLLLLIRKRSKGIGTRNEFTLQNDSGKSEVA